MAKGDVSSLPVWAQDLIRDAERQRDEAVQDLKDYEAENHLDLTTAAVVADPYSRRPRAIRNGTSIQFRNGNIAFIVKFYEEDGTLAVHAVGRKSGYGGMGVHPESSNSVMIDGRRRE